MSDKNLLTRLRKVRRGEFGSVRPTTIISESLEPKRPVARLITASPCFTVKANDVNYADRFACGTESGTLLVGDIGSGFMERSQAIREGLDED